jgi:hypothetical protein
MILFITERICAEVRPRNDDTTFVPLSLFTRITMKTLLSSSHQKTYDRLLEHPLPQNLHWREVWSMLAALGGTETVEDEKGTLKATRNGQTLVLHRPRTKDLADKDELLQVRHFLERSDAAVPAPAGVDTHLLVVIDHREARIYQAELHGTVPQRITPYDPFGFGRDLHYNQDDSNGQRKPEQKSFYEAVAKTLQGATKILMFGTGTGSSSAMEHLLADLKKNHHDLAERVVGSVAVDEHHLTEDQLLAKAREFFA